MSTVAVENDTSCDEGEKTGCRSDEVGAEAMIACPNGATYDRGTSNGPVGSYLMWMSAWSVGVASCDHSREQWPVGRGGRIGGNGSNGELVGSEDWWN